MLDWDYLQIRQHLFFNDSYNWMQFTGLTDKNGKKIYEGDVLDFTFFTYSGFEFEQTKRGFIEFNGLAFIFKVSYHEFYELVNLNFDSQSDCEIIGNIYENPELINNTDNQSNDNV